MSEVITVEFCCGIYPEEVRVNCVKSGELRMINGGWAYFPKGRKPHSEIFQDIYKLKLHIEKELKNI